MDPVDEAHRIDGGIQEGSPLKMAGHYYPGEDDGNTVKPVITETSPYKSDPRFPPTYSKNGGNLGSESK